MPLAVRQIEPEAAVAPEEDWRQIASALTGYVRKRTQRHDVVEDIVQETVLRLMDYRGKGQLVSVYALAFRIAGNLVIDRFRTERRYAAEAVEEPMSPTALPDRVLAGRQELASLMQALQAMPPLRREVIIRRRLHGQSCATIARELDLNPKAVEKHITRGLVDLNKARMRSEPMERHQS